MRVYTGILMVASCVYAATGQSEVAIGLWATLFAFSVLLPHIWRKSALVPIGYALALIATWTRDAWVLFAFSVGMAVLSGVGL